MFITLVATLAQWERETTAERVRDSMQKKAELGLRNGAKSPMGYDQKEGNLYINHAESEIVKYIFEMYKTKGVTSIVKSLNSRGVKTKQGKIFNYDAVRYIINLKILFQLHPLKFGACHTFPYAVVNYIDKTLQFYFEPLPVYVLKSVSHILRILTDIAQKDFETFIDKNTWYTIQQIQNS
ncbi:recombinase family protein, partial [Bacillus sp. HC-Mk]